MIGRVTVRSRREAFSSSVRAMVPADEQPVGRGLAGVSAEALSLIRPDHARVEAMRSRAGLLARWLTNGARGVRRAPGAFWQRLRQRRATEAADAVHSIEAPPVMTEASDARVIAPTRTPLTERLRQGMVRVGTSVRRRRRHAAVEVTVTPPVASPDVPAVASSGSAMRVVTHRVVRSTAAEAPAVVGGPVLTHVAKTSPRLLRRRKHAPDQGSPLQQAAVALAAANYQAAEDILVNHIVKHTKDTQAYMLLGQAAVGRRNWDEAMEIFEQVVAWDEHHEGALASLGDAAYHAGRYGRALQVLQRAHTADATNEVILDQLLSIARKMDNRALQHSIEEKLVELKRATAATHAPVA